MDTIYVYVCIYLSNKIEKTSSGKKYKTKSLILVITKVIFLSCIFVLYKFLEWRLMLSEISQREEDKYYYITCIWNLNKLYSQRQRVEWWLPGAQGWENWGDAVKGYKLATRRWRSSGILMYNLLITVILYYILWSC